MEKKYTHYTNFGISAQPRIADAEGYVEYREGYKDMPTETWTISEIWIARQSLRVSVQNGSVDEFEAIDRQIELQEVEQAYWDRMQCGDDNA